MKIIDKNGWLTRKRYGNIAIPIQNGVKDGSIRILFLLKTKLP